jgi:hypothetical protein
MDVVLAVNDSHEEENPASSHRRRTGNPWHPLEARAQYSANTPVPPAVYQLRQQLLTAVLPDYLALPDNPHLKPDEDPSRYLLRVAGEAAARAVKQ